MTAIEKVAVAFWVIGLAGIALMLLGWLGVTSLIRGVRNVFGKPSHGEPGTVR